MTLSQWQKLYYRHRQQYIRKRLDAIKLLMDGQSRTQVCQQLNCSYDTLTSWIDAYLTGGLAHLVVAITHDKPSRLTVEQQQQSPKRCCSNNVQVIMGLTAKFGIEPLLPK